MSTYSNSSQFESQWKILGATDHWAILTFKRWADPQLLSSVMSESDTMPRTSKRSLTMGMHDLLVQLMDIYLVMEELLEEEEEEEPLWMLQWMMDFLGLYRDIVIKVRWDYGLKLSFQWLSSSSASAHWGRVTHICVNKQDHRWFK